MLVTAKITDDDGVAGAELQYQVNNPGEYIDLGDPTYEQTWVSLPMNDAGTSGDRFPGDAIYSAEIPGQIQAHRRLVRYRIKVTDRGGRTGMVPYPDDPQPNFAYFVYDGVPAWSGAIQPGSTDPARNTPVTYGTNVMRKLAVYHLISKKASVQQATWPSANERYFGNQYQLARRPRV